MSSVEEIVQEFRDRTRGAPAIVRAGDVAEAVAVAERLKALGEAQWFRGQTQNWPKLAPTIWRLSPGDVESAKQQFARLASWAQRTAGLEDLSAKPDALLAVAQHYGVPTPFLDFTTDPRIAGFFATDGEGSADGTESVIICLNVDEACRRWGDVARMRNEPVPELLTLDVANLWRLEAQHGAFVWCPYESLDAPYPLARIVFPYTSSYELSRSEVYPELESPLERLLNQFFQAEANRGGMDGIAEEFHGAGVAFQTLAFEAREYRAEAFSQAPDPHPSWDLSSIRPWLTLDREYWRDSAAGPRQAVQFWLETPTLMALRVTVLVLRICEDDPALRSRSPRWVVEVDTREAFRERLRIGFQRVWDGMTHLPYTTDEIALAMGTTAGLILASELAGDDADTAAESFFSQPVALMIGRSDSRSHSRAWARESSIRAAVRDDFEALLVPAEREATFALPFNLLITARNPRLLFAFEGLKTLFARELIPTQVALDHDHPTTYSPARVDVVGPA